LYKATPLISAPIAPSEVPTFDVAAVGFLDILYQLFVATGVLGLAAHEPIE